MDAAESNRSWGGRRCELTDRAAIRSVMPALGIQAAQPRPKVTTAAPVEDLDRGPDLVNRDSRRRGAGA